MKILLTGATGLIGKELGKTLVREGHQVFVVSRDAEKAKRELSYPATAIAGDLVKGKIQDPRLSEIEAVIHLMGESVAGGRWTAEKKKKILDSRIQGTRHLLESLREAKSPLQTLVSTSAVGFYGDQGDAELNESAKAGDDFLADVCVRWEKEAARTGELFPQARIVIFRLGIVLSPSGGALQKMLPPFRLGLGGALGDGRQWMSWIHVNDVVRAFARAVGDSRMRGVYNLTAPEPARNREFSEKLAGSLGKKLGPRVPKFALKALFGEMSHALLASQKAVPARLLEAGFQFEFKDLNSALREVV